MRVIGVLDLRDGLAVHARAGARESYAPVGVPDSSIAPGDALSLAHRYVDQFGLEELYIADLDAIMSTSQGQVSQAFQDGLIEAIAKIGAPLWLDAGISSVDGAHHALAIGASYVVVGLETLRSFDKLADICSSASRDRVAFSLDLRDSKPLVGMHSAIGVPARPAALAARAADAGVGNVIVLDLARVGLNAGLDVDLIARIRDAVPGVTMLAGGGVRGLGDLAKLSEAGCDGALVATAVHHERLGPAEIAAAKLIQRPLVK